MTTRRRKQAKRTPRLTPEAVREAAALAEALMQLQYVMPSEVAVVKRCSVSHVRRAIRRGELAAIPVGRTWRVTPAAIREWMAAPAVVALRPRRVS